jgi:hypothetical protein
VTRFVSCTRWWWFFSATGAMQPSKADDSDEEMGFSRIHTSMGKCPFSLLSEGVHLKREVHIPRHSPQHIASGEQHIAQHIAHNTTCTYIICIFI